MVFVHTTHTNNTKPIVGSPLPKQLQQSFSTTSSIISTGGKLINNSFISFWTSQQLKKKETNKNKSGTSSCTSSINTVASSGTAITLTNSSCYYENYENDDSSSKNTNEDATIVLRGEKSDDINFQNIGYGIGDAYNFEDVFDDDNISKYFCNGKEAVKSVQFLPFPIPYIERSLSPTLFDGEHGYRNSKCDNNITRCREHVQNAFPETSTSKASSGSAMQPRFKKKVMSKTPSSTQRFKKTKSNIVSPCSNINTENVNWIGCNFSNDTCTFDGIGKMDDCYDERIRLLEGDVVGSTSHNRNKKRSKTRTMFQKTWFNNDRPLDDLFNIKLSDSEDDDDNFSYGYDSHIKTMKQESNVWMTIHDCSESTKDGSDSRCSTNDDDNISSSTKKSVAFDLGCLVDLPCQYVVVSGGGMVDGGSWDYVNEYFSCGINPCLINDNDDDNVEHENVRIAI